MKRDEVHIGRVYSAKVSDKLVAVRIDAENRHGGWDGTNLNTGKKVRIKSAQRLRAEVTAEGADAAQVADVADAVGTAMSGAHLRTAKKGKAATKAPKATKAKGKDAKAAKRPSGLDAAARVLAESKEPMTVREIIDVAFKKGYWKSEGATPHATIYSAMIREIGQKGKDSRFKKVERGKFVRA